MADKPRIYCFPLWHNPEDGFPYGIVALAEDGSLLAQHVSLSLEDAKHDIGITSDWQHKHYAEHYPDGYELEWVEDPSSHEDAVAAYARNREMVRQEREVAERAEWLRERRNGPRGRIERRP